MAPVARPAVITPETKRFIEETGELIVQSLNDQFFEVDGTPTATVKYEDGQFKKKPLIAGWNFMPAYSYVGQRGKMIFGLSPEDTQPYQFIEMDAKELDYAFPLIGPAVAKIFGLEGEKLHVVLEEVIAKRAVEEAARQEEAKAEAENNYDKVETFGMF